MTEPISAIATAVAIDPASQNAAAAGAPLHATSPAGLQPGAAQPTEKKIFAELMQGPASEAPHVDKSSSFADGARSLAARFGDNMRSFEDMRHSMMQSVDLRDPIKTMFAMTDHAIEANMMFTKLHLSTSLASSATSLFSTLLKNQQ